MVQLKKFPSFDEFEKPGYKSLLLNWFYRNGILMAVRIK
jgi:hypothetical protein